MKKKFSICLLSLIMLPLIAFFGCDTPSSYSVKVSSSSTIQGSVSGSGTYEEGSTITLTATAKSGKTFVAWVYQNTTMLQDDSTYTITNTTSDGLINKSTLTFTASSSTQGTYTAVFAEDQMMYVIFDSLYLSTSADATGTDDDGTQEELLTATIDISQGQNSYVTIYSSSMTLRDSVLVSAEDITGVLNLSTETAQYVRANVVFTVDGVNYTYTFRASLLFQQDIEQTSGTNYSYTVTYTNGVYKICFAFELDGTEYYLTLNYVNLS